MKDLIIVDLQDVTRVGFKNIVLQCDILENMYDGSCKDDIVEFLNKHEDGIVVLDYSMFDISEEFLLILHARYTKAAYIFFSDSLSPDFLKRIVYSSISFSVLLKDCTIEEIEYGIRRVCGNNQYICKKVISQLTEEHDMSSVKDNIPLSNTEREILRLIALGKSTKEIASIRFLSVYTVMTHRKNIFRKLQVNNVNEATRYAIRAGLIDPMEYYI